MSKIYIGALAPEALKYVVSSNGPTPPAGSLSEPDLSLVASAILRVKYPDLSHRDWTATILAQTATLLTLAHPFVTEDIDQLGTHWVLAVMTLGDGGIVRSVPRIFTVIPQF